MKIEVRYKGPGPDTGRMSALEIGPAIFGLGQMVGETSRLLYGEDKRVRVEVRADFEHASFGIEFFAVAPVADLLGGLSLEQLANICAVLGFAGASTLATGKGLLWLLRWQSRRQIDKAEKIGDEYHISIGEQTVNITVNEYKVFVDPKVRDGLRAVLAPLENEGVESLELRAENEKPETILRNERDLIATAPLPDQEISVDVHLATLEIISISFKPGYKWRFSQGQNMFFAEIAHKEFLAQVSQHKELFGAGDALRCEMEVRVTKNARGVFTFDHRILKVLEHIRAEPGGGQLSLVDDAE